MRRVEQGKPFSGVVYSVGEESDRKRSSISGIADLQ